MSPCDLVTERLALGEPLGDDEAHVATCPACSRLVGLPRLVAAAAHAAEPNPGFAIRAAAGARTKLAVRRRHRIAGNLAVAAAAVVIAVWAVKTPVEAPPAIPTTGMTMPPGPLEPVGDNGRDAELVLTDDQLGRELVRISDYDRAVAPSPEWKKAQAPLADYRLIVHQGAVR